MKNMTSFFLKIGFAFAITFSIAACNDRDNLSDAYGNFEAVEVTIAAQTSGEIMQFDIEEGEQLVAGQRLGFIDTIALSLRRSQLVAQRQAIFDRIPNLDAQVAVYLQQKENMKRDLKRIEKMYEEGAATQKQLDDITGQMEVIDRQVTAVKSQKQAVYSEMKSLEQQILLVDESIQKSLIINPMKGTVLTKYANAHEMAVPGKALYKIADLNPLKLKVYISGEQLPNLRLNDSVEVWIDRTATENRRLTGRVSQISDNAEFTPKIIQTKQERVNLVYAVTILVPNDGSLKIGMPAEVNFVKHPQP
ncbi:HlyD family efflux transporter periplasmic adaptor subunit [Candidatus Falkowbacteria bacterium]|jgi:HlyD family secretion protein|nr:HlyD family efflux transporter periplasmic adaptor subunit [Candidatus Falkowbacteria bacterium]